MRLHRFYVEQPLGEVVVIKDVSLIQQWTKVFRYTVSDFVVLFNGEGSDLVYSLDSIEKKECTLIRNKQSPSYIPTKKVTLYLSIIKKDNFELVVQKATELGVTTIIPIISERSEKKNLNDERLRKIAIEASEQCGRGDIPLIPPITELSSVLKELNPSEACLFLQMDGIAWNDALLQKKLKEGKVHLFIGPEGGWSPDEENLFRKSGATSVSLGPTVLRAETAAIVSVALAQQ
jgi:16S rRNA (uracil1498-N3)-methyltransferase